MNRNIKLKIYIKIFKAKIHKKISNIMFISFKNEKLQKGNFQYY